MTDTDTSTDDAVDVPSILRHRPHSIADALDVHLRLTVLSAWVNERKGHVADWLKAKGEARIAEDGAAPTWRLTDGTVLLTDPQPKPAVDDRERFGAWYTYNVVGVQTPVDPQPDAPDVIDAYCQVYAEISIISGGLAADPLATFAAEVKAAEGDDARVARAARMLVDATRTRVEWVVSETLLDDLLAGTVAATDDAGPRCVIHTPDEGDAYVVDTVTGERVPGVVVRPAGQRTVQVRPNAKARTRVRGELDNLLGAPALEA